MARIALIHWKEEEGLRRVAQLRKSGFDARLFAAGDPPKFGPLRDDPPDALVIDLTRLPSQGREVATILRQSKKTRHVPLVFAGGPPDKVALIRERLPDATYAEWERIESALQKALRMRIAAPAVPPRLEGYSTSSLPKKLGARPGRTIALLNAPDGFEERLQPLEQGQLADGLHKSPGMILLFVESQAEFEAQATKTASVLPDNGALWIIYPKRSSGIRSDLTQNGIREFGIALGLVDYKVCSVDETWTGMCFARRKGSRS